MAYLFTMIPIVPGILLISDPFLKDPNFKRTVILLCEHRQEGSVGFVLNKSLNINLDDIITEAAGIGLQVYDGGPVQKDTLHFIHRRPDLIQGGIAVFDNVYWGGDFEQVLELLRNRELKQNDIRFFVGYSGWSEDQLKDELEQKSWITRQADSGLVFHTNKDLVWQDALKELGGEYRQMVNYPIDPQLN
ncbi:YqgE/AlgH family protein [Sediminibacterium ginsengisoli]|nr:YqgE/AlgH family protein [Sediminibacterium ginsengisoli]